MAYVSNPGRRTGTISRQKLIQAVDRWELEKERAKERYNLLPLFSRKGDKILSDRLKQIGIEPKNFQMRGVSVSINYEIHYIQVTARFSAGDYNYSCYKDCQLSTYHKTADFVLKDVFESGNIFREGVRDFEDAIVVLNHEEDLRERRARE